MTVLSFASCSNSAGGDSNSGGSQYSINYSLGTPPDENLSFEKLNLNANAKEESEGIYLEFDIPNKTSQYRVSIEGLGAVAESVCVLDEDETKGCFFYPFVDAEKEYTIRIVFLREEDYDNEGFSLGHRGDDGTIAWFQKNVKAGAKSKGEVRLTSKGEIYVNEKGDFKFTKRPTFQNEHLLGNDWAVNMGLVEGVSWEHGEERRTKWNAAEIPQAAITELYNLYDNKYTIWGNPIVIDFICVRPVKSYKHDGKIYNYQWESFTQDIFYPQKIVTFEDIDINNSSSIQGTWKCSENWYNDNTKGFPMNIKFTEIFAINDKNLKITIIYVYTKMDGSAFTEEEKKNFSLSNSDNYKITEEQSRNTTLSEYSEENINTMSWHRQWKLSKDSDLGSKLQVFTSYENTENESNGKWTRIYRKQ